MNADDAKRLEEIRERAANMQGGRIGQDGVSFLLTLIDRYRGALEKIVESRPEHKSTGPCCGNLHCEQKRNVAREVLPTTREGGGDEEA